MATETIARLHVTYRPSVTEILTGALHSLVEDALVAIARQSAHHGMSECVVIVSDFLSAEDETQQVVLTQLVDLPPQRALDYGEALAVAIWDWTENLSKAERELVRAWIVTDVDWDVEPAAIRSA